MTTNVDNINSFESNPGHQINPHFGGVSNISQEDAINHLKKRLIAQKHVSVHQIFYRAVKPGFKYVVCTEAEWTGEGYSECMIQ